MGKGKLALTMTLATTLTISSVVSSLKSDVFAQESSLLAKTPASAQVVGQEIYVSQDGNGDGTKESPKSFLTAMAEAKDGDVFIIEGTINLPEGWQSPACAITIKGANKETSVLKMAMSGTGSDDQPSILLEGNLTLDNLMLDVAPHSNPYFSSMFVIVANGKKLVIGKDAYTKSDTSKYMGRVFGGGFHQDIDGDTYIENNGTLLVTNIYGGGCAGDVSGHTNINVTGSCVNIYGGGLSIYKSPNTANVGGNVNINIKNAQLTGRYPHVYGAGDGSEADAYVKGNVTIYHDGVKDGGKNIYGAGIADDGNAYVGGNVEITVKNYDMANNGSTIYGGGIGKDANTSAGVKGNVMINYENGNFGKIYGAGEKYANVDGKTTIDLKNIKGTPVVYGGGKSDKNYQVQSNGEVVINLLNSKVDLYTQGVNASVNELVTVNLYGGGADRDVNSVGCNLYNRVRSSDTDGRDYGQTSEDFRAVVNVVDGINIITTINDFENINIQNGSLLEHVRYYDGSGTASDGPRELFNNVGHLTIETNGQLDLLGDNEINDAFITSGNLKTVSGAKLIVGGNVTSNTGASYTSTDFDDTYTKSYPFLQMKGNDNKEAAFKATDPSYVVKHRDSVDEGIVQEWYLDVENRTVEFNSNGGSYVESQVVKHNEKAIEPENPSKDGYVFAGWYKDEKLEELYDFETPVTANITLYAKWDLKAGKINAAPTISASDVTLTVGDSFDPLKGVSASDAEDGNIVLTLENVIENDVDMTKAGKYKVTYAVSDSLGAKVTKTIYVTVNPKMGIINAAPTISASDLTLTVGDSFDPLKGVSASDAEDGNIVLTLENVIENDVDMTKAGKYKVTYAVSDSLGAKVTKTIYVTVNPKMGIINAAPTISASDVTLTVGDSFDPLKGVSASDVEDGVLSDKIEVLSNTVDLGKAGVYEVTYKVCDLQGAMATKTIKVVVKEAVKDEQNGPQTGDDYSIGLLASVVALSGLGMALVLLKKKKVLKNK